MPHPPAAPPRWLRPSIQRLQAQKYSLTLGIILLAHVGLAGVDARHAVVVAPVVTLTLYFLGFILLRDHSRLARAILLTGAGALGLSAVEVLVGGKSWLAAALAGHALFLLLVIVFMLGRVFREKKVTLDQIMAGIIIYLLMVGLWAQFYGLTLLADPGAISTASGSFGDRPFLTIYYFSVITLTTAGFGDIVPVSDTARILAAYEALVGQVYLVVFIALLLGRHFADR